MPVPSSSAIHSMTQPLRRTPLYQTHAALGGRLMPFAGWEMPIQFGGILAEARAVRSGCGLFDVSHMGRIMVEGAQAGRLLDWVHTADIAAMSVHRARYGVLCNERGGIIDDGIVYRLDEQRFMLVANAANVEQVLSWLHRWREDSFPHASITNVTQQQAMIAVQGPQAISFIEAVSNFSGAQVRPFWCFQRQIQGRAALIARTGYTGEDGVEVILPSEDAPWLWELLRQRGAVPCGLGARDVLRLEAGLLLHGTDMDASTNPVEAGLERFVKLDKRDFCGADAVRRALVEGVQRRLAAFRMVDRSIPRHGYAITDGAHAIGHVASGGYSPTLDRAIGLGYVPMKHAVPGTRFLVDIRGRAAEAEVVSLPFYSRTR